LGQTQEAEIRYKEAISLSPFNHIAIKGLAHVKRDQGKYVESRDLFTRAVALDPNDATLLIQLGLTCDKMNDIEGAEKAARAAMKIDPKCAEAYNFLGYMFAERKVRLDESVELIAKALELEPENANILDSMGWALYQKGEIDKAIETLEKAVSLLTPVDEEGSSVIFEHLGDALQAKGKTDQAVLYWQKAVGGNPPSKTAEQKIIQHQLKTTPTP